MKNSMILFAVAVCFVAFTSSCEKDDYSPGGDKDGEIRLEENVDETIMNTADDNTISAIFIQGEEERVAIKVYTNPGGQEKLLVFDPTQHNMFVYNTDEYTIEWTKNGESTSDEVFLENVCAGSYKVTVYSEVDGEIGSASYRSNANCKTNDSSKIF